MAPGGACLKGRDELLQRLHIHLEAPVFGPAAKAIHPAAERLARADPFPQFLHEPRSVRYRQKEGRIQHGLQEPWIGGQPVRDARRPAHHDGDEIREPSVGAQHGEEANVLRQRGEEAVQPRQGAIRVWRFAQRLNQVVHDGADDLAHLIRRGGGVAAFRPAAQRLERALGVLEATGAQAFGNVWQPFGPSQHGFGNVVFAFGHVETGQVERMGFAGGGAEALAEFIHRRAHEPCDVGHAVIGGRQGLRLVVVRHLQPMLHAAEQQVGVAQRGRLAGQDVVFLLQGRQHRQHPGATQTRAQAAMRELMHVDEELDFADAATPQLDVPAAQLDFAVAVEIVDLLAHRADFLHRAKVQRLVPHERRQALHELFAGFDVPSHGPRLNHRGPFPSAPHALVVVEGEVHGDGRRRRGRVRPQAQVRAEHIAIRGARLHQGDEVPREAGEVFAQGAPALVAAPLRVVEHDEVDVGGIVELAGTVLAHRQREVTPSVLFGHLHLAPFHALPEQMRDGQPGAVIRHVGEQPRAMHDIPDAEAVAEAGHHRDAIALHPQQAHQGVLVHAGIGLPQRIRDAAFEDVRWRGDQRFREGDIAQQKRGEVRAVAEQEGEERCSRAGVQRFQQRVRLGALRRLPQAIDAGFGAVFPMRLKGIETGCRGG